MRRWLLIAPLIPLIGIPAFLLLPGIKMRQARPDLKVAVQNHLTPVHMIFVGDIMLSRGVAMHIRRHHDLDWPFERVRNSLRRGDLVFGNLECTLTPGPPVAPRAMVFRANPALAPLLRQAGFNLLSLANNHSPNYGPRGLRDEMRVLRRAGIAWAGAGNDASSAAAPAVLTIKGQRIALLAYNSPDVVPAWYAAGPHHAGTNFMNVRRMQAAVRAARRQGSFVIVSMHAGTEYHPRANRFQIAFAHAAIDAGAGLVIGHHPHVIETAERYRGKYIFYSLGNFIFDQQWSRATRLGLMLEIWVQDNQVLRLRLHAIWINPHDQPVILPAVPVLPAIARLRRELKLDPVSAPVLASAKAKLR